MLVNRNTNEGQIIDYNLLADKILEKLRTKIYSNLTTSSKVMTGAINELDSDIATINNNLAWKSVPQTVASLSDFCAYIDEQIGSTNGTLSGYIGAAVSGNIGLPANGHYLQVYANSSSFRICIVYSTGAIRMGMLAKAGGTWMDTWKTITFT